MVLLQVLMLAYMDRAALAETIESGEATFFSRSRGGRWRKGETSGHRLKIMALTKDCDSDALLLSVEPLGSACHLGTASCFGDATAPGLGRLGALERTIEARAAKPGEQSWTSALLASGVKRIAQSIQKVRSVDLIVDPAARPVGKVPLFRLNVAVPLIPLCVKVRLKAVPMTPLGSCGLLTVMVGH